MRPDDWQLIQAHFEAICDMPTEDQEAALARLDVPRSIREQIAQLLAFDRDAGLEELAAEVDRFSHRLDQNHIIGQHVGPYRLLRPLGEGGMGEVFLAERADGRFEARVAIKFLAIRSERGQRLFDRERRILARLDHPAIARLLDAGDHPRLGAWLVMEYVDGQSIDQLVQQGTVDVRTRIRWLAEAARAVSSAHQNLILHRDIKPDHLIIDKAGQLKVLDFGVATLMDRHSAFATGTRSASFTPRYAAPEQILNQPTTTATDVYGLGLVLHELLSGGHGPFGEDPTTMSEAKLADRLLPLPRQPDLTNGQWRDLQAVVKRCLRRRAEDRYPGPDGLAADLEAILNDQPVSARPPLWSEQLRRWHKHHRFASAALFIAVLAVVVGSGFSAWFAHTAGIERNVALQEAAKAHAVMVFLESIFTSSTPGIEQGPETTVREVLDRGSERIDEELESQPEVAAYLALPIARSYMYLGLYDPALALLGTGRQGESEPVRQGRILLSARITNLKARYQETIALLEPALKESLPSNQRAEALIQLATARINLGELAAAEAAARQAIAVAEKDEEGFDRQASAHNLLGAIAYNRGDLDLAREAFDDLLQMRVSRYGEIHDGAGQTLGNLATIAYAQGDLATALDHARRSAAILAEFFGVENRAVGMAHRTIGMIYRHLGQVEDADHYLARSLAVLDAWGGRDFPFWRSTLLQRVELNLMTGHETVARDLLADVLPLEDIDWQPGEELIACRLQRLAVAAGLTVVGELSCHIDSSEPAQSRAVGHYLLARHHWQTGHGPMEEELARARVLLPELIPPDPLLEQALTSLQPIP